MKRVLVAGATGYLGGFVALEFKARGHLIRALARSPEKLDHLHDSLDEIVEAEVTQPETLSHVCDGIDVVFSSIGITKQKDKITFRDVDYQGNKNLLEVAQRAGVEKFIYVSVFNGPNLSHLDIVKAHEDFVDVGGPQTMTWSEVATLAFTVLGRPAKVTCIPEWLMWSVVDLLRIFNRHQGELPAFFTTMATTDVVAPSTGTHTLESHFERGGTMKVQDLSQYGKPLDDIPEDAKAAQERIVMEMIKRKYGWFGRFPFFIRMYFEQRRLKKQYSEALARLRFYGSGASREFLMLVAMFNIFARTDGREDAGKSIMEMFQRVAAEAGMAALYQVDELVNCEGDVYENFTKFNIAMFEGSQHLYDSTHTVDPDKHTIIVTRCANVEFADAFDCPELRALGCNFDLGGFPAIEDRAKVEFRRPITIANGSDRCEFSFYRKGTAPETEEIDGETVRWESHLNR